MVGDHLIVLRSLPVIEFIKILRLMPKNMA